MYVRGNQIEIHGPYQGDLTIERVIAAQMDGVYFPVTIREFGAHITYRDLREESLAFGPVRIDSMLLKHPGYALGYRFTAHTQLKVQYSIEHDSSDPSDYSHNFAGQLTVKF